MQAVGLVCSAWMVLIGITQSCFAMLCPWLTRPRLLIQMNLVLLLGVFLWEGLLRGLVQKRWPQTLLPATLLWAATGITLGPWAVLAQLLPGFIWAWLYRYQEHPPWWHFGLVQVQFTGLWMVIVLGATLSGTQPFYRDFLVEYKRSEILAGKVFYRQGWGWVDRTHYDQGSWDTIGEWLETHPQQPLKLYGGFGTAPGPLLRFSREYRLLETLNPGDLWAIRSGILLDIQDTAETLQGQTPWVFANRISAYSTDDLRSALLLALDHRLEPAVQIEDRDRLLQLWGEESTEPAATRRVRLQDLPQFLSPPQSEAYAEIEAARRLWQAAPVEVEGLVR